MAFIQDPQVQPHWLPWAELPSPEGEPPDRDGYQLWFMEQLQETIDEMVFVNTEIGGSKLNFEYLVDYQTSQSTC